MSRPSSFTSTAIRSGAARSLKPANVIDNFSVRFLHYIFADFAERSVRSSVYGIRSDSVCKSAPYENYKEDPARWIQTAFRFVLLAAMCLFGVTPGDQVSAQSKLAGTATSPLCTQENALEMIKQQVGLTKTFDNSTRRITVLIRAADLLWPYELDKARAAFAEAFDLAKETEKENEQKGPRWLLLRLQKPDLRYVVIRAVARKDSTWAKELTGQLLKAANDSAASATRSSFENSLTAARLLDSAIKLIDTDINAASDLARASLNYAASSWLTHFLYRLAAVNQPAADQFYAQALGVYGDKPMREFLYLQAYPFAWSETLNTPVFSYYQVPDNFRLNSSLQRRFLQVLLRRAQQALETPLDQGDAYRTSHGALMPGTVHLLEGMIRLESDVRGAHPDLWASFLQAREKILVSLSVETQKLLVRPGHEISTEPVQTFAEQVELAQKASDVYERDDLIANAVLVVAAEKESLANVIQAIDKISNANLRGALLEWLYFRRVKVAIENKQVEEAVKLAGKVEGHEQRAFLHIEIAKGLLKNSDTQTYGREILEEAISEARKAGVSLFAARTLLTASNLYATIDLNRSIAVLADAINCINRLEAPDFSSDDQALEMKPERKVKGGAYGGEYNLRFYMPGLDPESAFREMAKLDFDTALSQSNALTDKFQRALATLALAEVCLVQVRQQPKDKPRKSTKP